MLNKAVVATNRFGLGAKGNENAQATTAPKMWLLSQLKTLKYNTKLADSSQILTMLSDFRLLKKQEKIKDKNTVKDTGKAISEPISSQIKAQRKEQRSIYKALVADSFNHLLTADNSLSWRLLDFFSNHFSVSAQGPLSVLAPTLEREAIAPNLLGNFEQLLGSVIKHPAMLLYLNNERSFGPNSRLGKRGKGLNENLAREILELHTLGVKGPYDQNDVIELAKGISGWSITNPAKEKATGFTFRSRGHEPGKRTLLSKEYSDTGIQQGEAMLVDLARHPSTAQFMCFKLVRHFVSDNPDPKLVSALEKTWLATNGNIKAVMSTLINNDLAWQSELTKFKTPREFVVSVYRALGVRNIKPKSVLFILTTLGQAPFKAGSPAGYADVQESWNGANALMAKIEWVNLLVQKKRYNAEDIMTRTLQLAPTDKTYKHVLRAESRQVALTLLLLSPEFLRR